MQDNSESKKESKAAVVQKIIDYLNILKKTLKQWPDYTSSGFSPYHLAAISGNEAQMQKLLEQSDAADRIKEAATKVVLTPLQLAVAMNNLGIVKLIKKHFLSVIYEPCNSGESILHFSMSYGTLEITKEFMMGDLLNRVNLRNKTPLMIAMAKNDIETVKALLELNCRLGDRSADNYDEIASSVLFRDLQSFQLIANKLGSNIDYTKLYILPDQQEHANKFENRNCFTLLGLAAIYDAPRIIEALLPHYSEAEIESVVFSFFDIVKNEKGVDALFRILNKHFELKGKLPEFSQHCLNVIQIQGWNKNALESILEFGKKPEKKLSEQKESVRKEVTIQTSNSAPKQFAQQEVSYTVTQIPTPSVSNDPIIDAINRGNMLEVLQLQEVSKFDMDNPYAEKVGENFMHYVANNKIDLVQIFMVTPGFNHNKVGHQNWRPIHVALHFRREEIAIHLLQNNMDYSEEFLGRSIFYSAAEKGLLRVVEELLPKENESEARALRKKQNIEFHVSGERALIAALKNGHSDVAMALIKAGANVNSKDRNNLTPLMYAVQWGFAQVVDALIKKAANIESFDAQGNNVLLHAIMAFAGNVEELNKSIYEFNKSVEELKKYESNMTVENEALNLKLSAEIDRLGQTIARLQKAMDKLQKTIGSQLETIKVLFSYKPKLHEENNEGIGIGEYVEAYPQLNELFKRCYPSLPKLEQKASKRKADGVDFFSDKRRLTGAGVKQTANSTEAGYCIGY